MSNARRFINSYNKIDVQLRNLYDFKANQSFSDMVRRSADKNLVVRKYENELIDYARLRNAIIHKSIDEVIIAEPNDEVTQKFEMIEKLLCTPPKISEIFKDKNIISIEQDINLREVILLFEKTGYSNIPVYCKGVMIGVINHKRIVRAIGKVILNGMDIDDYLNETNCGKILSPEDMITYYAVLSKHDTIERTALMFEQNKKLRAVLITEKGFVGERVLNLLTSIDLALINKILEDYE
jgi:predicted transcriptional regulator